jgi:hypothetical protein
MARKDNSENPGRIQQIRQAYTMTKRSDPRIGLILLAIGIIIFGVLLGVGFLIDSPIIMGVLGFTLAFLGVTIVFGRRAEAAAFNQMAGQPGAAAAALNSLTRGWVITPAVSANRNQDVVHRAVGRAGIVLVGEGNPNRLKTLLAAEKRKMARVLADVPVQDVVVGDHEDQVPLKKLKATLLRLPKTLSNSQVTDVNDRLRAMGDLLSNMPVPKGPLPKGARMPKGPGR